MLKLLFKNEKNRKKMKFIYFNTLNPFKIQNPILIKNFFGIYDKKPLKLDKTKNIFQKNLIILNFMTKIK